MDTLNLVLAQINTSVGDISNNIARIHAVMHKTPSNTDLVIFPEMCISGYPLADLVWRPDLLRYCRNKLSQLAIDLKNSPAVLLGCPWVAEKKGNFLDRSLCLEQTPIYNAVMLLKNGKYYWVSSKYHLPNEGIFDEKRQFAQPKYLPELVTIKGIQLGVMVCHDMWFNDVSDTLAKKGAKILISINASPYEWNKLKTRMQTCLNRVSETGLPLIMVNQIGGEDGVVFDGSSFILNRNNCCPIQLPSFRESIFLSQWQKNKAEDWTCIVTQPLWIGDDLTSLRMKTPNFINIIQYNHQTIDHIENTKDWELTYNAIAIGLRDFVVKSGFSQVILGLSGGIDSALVATIASDCLGSNRVKAILMPSPYTAQQSLDDAKALASKLKISIETLPINKLMQEYNQAIQPICVDGLVGLSAENIQARIRGNLLMSIANQFNALVLTTGNKSEISVGYCTLYGDMCGGFNPIIYLYKT